MAKLFVHRNYSSISFKYADHTARLAATGFTEDDLYKFASVASDKTVWMLQAISPSIIWERLSPLDEANLIEVTPDGNIASVTVQDALEELDAEKVSTEVFAATKGPTGFADRTTSTISFSSSTRTLTISPTGTTFDVWLMGVRSAKTAQQVVIDNTHGKHFVSFNASGVLVASTTEFDLEQCAPVAIILWDAVGGVGLLFDERHGIAMDWATHKHLHLVEGTSIVSGFALADYLLNTDSNAALAWTTAQGVIVDEDLYHTVAAQGNSGYAAFYRDTDGAWRWSTSALPFFFGTYIQFNRNNDGVWSLEDVASGEFVNYYILATPAGISVLPGQSAHSTLVSAQSESILSYSWGTMPFAETAPLYKITFDARNDYTTTGKCRIQAVEKVIAPRLSTTSFTSPTSHQSLSGLTDPNVHPASSISTSSIPGITATDVQGVLAELTPLASPTFTGTPAAPTANADTNTTQIATTAFVVGQAGSSTPAMDGVASVGSSLRYARQDHMHPSDTTKASSDHNHDSDYADIATGVTNGDSHDHSGGDGAQINHTTLSNIGSNTHGQIDTHIASTSNPHGVTATQLGLGNVTNDAQIPMAQKSAANGVCPLNSFTKIDSAYLPDSILGQVEYRGSWIASENVPPIPTAAAGNKGWYYVCADSGTLFGLEFTTGDWIISDGSKWDKIDNTDAVTSVFGRSGTVVAANGDYTASQVTNVPSGNIVATTVQGAINELDSEKAPANHDHSDIYEPLITTLPASKGGTGLSSYSAGSFINALDANTLQQRTPAQVLSDIGGAASSHAHTQAQSHNSPDTDLSTSAIHHTLGTGANQAAAGNHGHSGVYEPADANLQAHLLNINNPHSVTKAQVGLSNVTNEAQIPLTQKGASSGVCPLDANAKISTTYLPESMTGQLVYKGLWVASTNTPTLPTPGTGNVGWYYIATDSGTQFGNSYSVGDWAISDGTSWGIVDNSSGVTSVFGRTGNVTGANGDYTASQITNVASGNISATTVQAAINELDSEKQPIDATLTALAGLTISSNKLILCSGADAFSVGELTNAYVASNAGIDIGKLGQSGASTSQLPSWNGSAWSPTLIANANIATNAEIAVSKLGASGSSAGDALVSDGSVWAPAKLGNANIASDAGIVLSKLGASGAVADDVSAFNGTSWVPIKIANANIASNAAISLSKIGQSSATTGMLPAWSGTAWVPSLIANANIASDAAIALSKLGVSGAVTDDVAVYNGSAWAPTKITDSHVALSAKDGLAGVPCLRTLGTSATSAAAGNHNHSGVYEPTFTTLSVTKGGTGVATLTGLVKGNGTSAFSAAAAGTDFISPTGTETLSNKTLTAPKIVNSGYIADGSGNEQIQFANVGIAVNHIQVKNAITGTAPSISAIGDDTNVDLNLLGQGTGVVTTATAPADTNTTQVATTGFVVGQAGASNPLMNGTVAAGTSLRYARQDHIHPTDTNRQPADATLTALSGLTLSADKMLLVTGASSVTVGQLSNAYVASNAAIAITKLGTTGAAIEDVIYYNGTNLTFGKTPIVPLEPYATNTTPASTTLTTYQTYQSFTTPTLRAKTYKVCWDFRCNYSSNKDNMSARIIVDGATVLWEIAIPFPKTLASIRYPVTGFAFVAFASASAHTVVLEYMAGAFGTASMYDSVISITEVRTA